MKYISSEEFLKQDKKIQDVFIQWWKPQENDLFSDIEDLTLVECVDFIKSNDEGVLYYAHRYNRSEKETMIPLFTEGQLREFIEEKTKGLVDIIIERETQEYKYTYCFNIWTADGNELFNDYDAYRIDADDLLQAYWKVALEIAKSEIIGEK